MKKIIYTFYHVFNMRHLLRRSVDYVIDMQDSYGDGWNGASIDVSVNGNNVANSSISGFLEQTLFQQLMVM